MGLESNSEFEISKKFSGKIFCSKDIQGFMNFLRKTKSEISEEDTKLLFLIDYLDGTTIKGTDDSVLNDTKEIESISFSLKNFKENKNIKVFMNKHGGVYSLSSYDEDWVRAKGSTLEDYLAAIKNQNKFFSQMIYQVIIQNGLMILFGTSLYLYISFNFFPDPSKEDAISLFSLIIFSYVISGVGSFILTNKFYKLYPKIEFDTTREHLNKKKKKKKLLVGIAIIVFIPFLLEIIKYFIFLII